MTFTEDQILTLAPDEPSKKSGRDLANPSKWVTKGANEAALWGECQGSGSKPYQAVIDIKNIAFKCSCPSRKFPCKHGLGLFLLYIRQTKSFTNSEAPAWAAEWIAKRAQQEEKKSEKKEGKESITDEAAQAKRQQNRELKVSDGLAELHLWIKDIVRNGILAIPEKEPGFWDGMAKRLVDAQAPGLAGMVRNLGNINFFGEDWQTEFIDGLVAIYTLLQAYKNREALPPLLVQDIRAWIGFTQNVEEVKEQGGVLDTWIVLAKSTTQEDAITVERNWLYGTATGQYALVLQFFVRGTGGTGLVLTPGMYLQAELAFYPSVTPLRAIIKRHIATGAATPQKLYQHWTEVAEQETTLCAQFPVRSVRPYLVQELTLVQIDSQWWLQDKQNKGLPVKKDFKNLWYLLALSGGNALDMAVLGKENTYEPIGVWHNGIYKTI